MEADFGGYATKANIKCTDGKTIAPMAFAHQDKLRIPLVYNHGHSDPGNVLGHAILEHRMDGIYAHGYFNNTKQGQDAKEYIQHKDLDALSIFANKLVLQGQTVMHGQIRELSLVLAGANPEAKIDFVQIRHSDDPDNIETLTDEAVIHSGEIIEFDEPEDEEVVEHASKMAAKPTPTASSDSSGDGDGPTVQDVYDSMTEEQQNVCNYMVGQALESTGSAQHSDDADEDDEDPEDEDLAHQEGTGTVTNVFETASKTKTSDGDGEFIRHTIDQEGLEDLYATAKRYGSLKMALKEYQLAHGITNIEALFPDPKLLSQTPDFNSRNMDWVQNVLDTTRKTPFAKIKSIVGDITLDSARALGYVKGNFKKEEWFPLVSRTTGPTTVYKKQKLDRDDIIDTVDFNIVLWLQAEMRVMLSEEVATAILLGDGRAVDDTDKVKDPAGASDGDGIRSIMNDDELYVTRIDVNVGANYDDWSTVVDQVLFAGEYYQGTGSPTFYGTTRNINKMLALRDANLRRLYDDRAALAAAMNVSKIVSVDTMKRFPNVLGIIVNLADYNVGTDRGGEVNMFDQFDIDYNQEKYLMETRVSGALVKIKSAMVLLATDSANVLVQPTPPTFVKATGVVTIPTQTGTVYKLNGTGSALTAGPQTAMAAGATETIKALPASGYYFAVTGTQGEDEWTFQRPSA